MKEAPEVLLIEDDATLGSTIYQEFHDRGYNCVWVDSIDKVSAVIDESLKFAVIDLKVGTQSGLTALEKVIHKAPKCHAVILTGYGSLSTAVKAGRLGAVQYLTKPVDFTTLERVLWTGKIYSKDLNEEELKESHKPISLARHEREYIEFVLIQCNGNITQAAEWLGVHRQSLQRKLRKFSPRF